VETNGLALHNGKRDRDDDVVLSSKRPRLADVEGPAAKKTKRGPAGQGAGDDSEALVVVASSGGAIVIDD